MKKYQYKYLPEHPMADSIGKMYYHRYVMSEYLGRILDSDEIVHHIDRNPLNNEIENLELMTSTEHKRLHSKESFNFKPLHKKKCLFCKENFQPKKNKNKFCSPKCSNKYKRKINVSKEELKKLVWKYPMTKISEILKVSDRAIKKRCKKEGIECPPIGYWIRKEKIYKI